MDAFQSARELARGKRAFPFSLPRPGTERSLAVQPEAPARSRARRVCAGLTDIFVTIVADVSMCRLHASLIDITSSLDTALNLVIECVRKEARIAMTQIWWVGTF